MEQIKNWLRQFPLLMRVLFFRKIVTDPRHFFKVFVKPLVAKLCVRFLQRFIRVPALIINSRECVVDAGHARFAWEPGQVASLIGYPLSGTFEEEETRLALQIAPRAEVIFDVGGNFGWFAALFKNHAAPETRLHVFEPVPSARAELLHNLELNPRPEIRVSVVDRCLSHQPGTVTIYVPRQLGTACASMKIQSTFVTGEVAEIEVQATTIDEYCARNDIPFIDFLKIDVEGAEGLVLQGATRILSQERRPAIMVEIAEQYAATFGFSFSTIATRLQELGYRGFEFGKTGLRPILPNARPSTYNFLFLPPSDRFSFLTGH